MEALSATHYRCQCLQGNPNDVVFRFLRGKCATGRLGVKPKFPRLWTLGSKLVTDRFRPKLPRRAELCNFLKELVVTCKEETEPWRELVDVKPRSQRRPNVLNPIRQRECQFLHCCRTSLTQVVARNAYRVPSRQFPCAIRNRVGNQPQARTRGIDVRPSRDVLL